MGLLLKAFMFSQNDQPHGGGWWVPIQVVGNIGAQASGVSSASQVAVVAIGANFGAKLITHQKPIARIGVSPSVQRTVTHQVARAYIGARPSAKGITHQIARAFIGASALGTVGRFKTLAIRLANKSVVVRILRRRRKNYTP